MARQPTSLSRRTRRPLLLVRASAVARLAAARAFARRHGRPLHHVDLSADGGATESILDRAFRTADRQSAVLLFDEADALFGRRTAVRDAHDRYANIETSYLLQRTEGYRGVVILGTNQRLHMDGTLLRHCRTGLRRPE